QDVTVLDDALRSARPHRRVLEEHAFGTRRRRAPERAERIVHGEGCRLVRGPSVPSSPSSRSASRVLPGALIDDGLFVSRRRVVARKRGLRAFGGALLRRVALGLVLRVLAACALGHVPGSARREWLDATVRPDDASRRRE